MSIILAPVVGMHFYPPAKQVMTVLPSGCQLLLVPEPTNPYDEKAIQVFIIPAETIPVSQIAALEISLEGTGREATELVGSSELMKLGHVADSDGKICKARQCPGNREVGASGASTGTLVFDPDGQPMVQVTAPEAQP